jgi:hypothetical protein
MPTQCINQSGVQMIDTVDMMLSLADAIENGKPSDDDGTLVLNADQCSLIVQSLRDKAARLQVDQDRPMQPDEQRPMQADQEQLLKHVEAALEV